MQTNPTIGYVVTDFEAEGHDAGAAQRLEQVPAQFARARFTNSSTKTMRTFKRCFDWTDVALVAAAASGIGCADGRARSRRCDRDLRRPQRGGRGRRRGIHSRAWRFSRSARDGHHGCRRSQRKVARIAEMQGGMLFW